MFYPKLFNDDFFDDFMGLDFPRFRGADDVEKKLYGKHVSGLMKTDVRDRDGNYELDIDLPGFKKDEITLELQHGYLTVTAAKGLDKEESNKGRVIRKERYAGTMQRSFYVGDALTEADIGARLEHGVLSLNIPKRDAKKVPEKKTIMIEG